MNRCSGPGESLSPHNDALPGKVLESESGPNQPSNGMVHAPDQDSKRKTLRPAKELLKYIRFRSKQQYVISYDDDDRDPQAMKLIYSSDSVRQGVKKDRRKINDLVLPEIPQPPNNRPSDVCITSPEVTLPPISPGKVTSSPKIRTINFAGANRNQSVRVDHTWPVGHRFHVKLAKRQNSKSASITEMKHSKISSSDGFLPNIWK